MCCHAVLGVHEVQEEDTGTQSWRCFPDCSLWEPKTQLNKAELSPDVEPELIWKWWYWILSYCPRAVIRRAQAVWRRASDDIRHTKVIYSSYKNVSRFNRGQDLDSAYYSSSLLPDLHSGSNVFFWDDALMLGGKPAFIVSKQVSRQNKTSSIPSWGRHAMSD